jgi:hypothetical protein
MRRVKGNKEGGIRGRRGNEERLVMSEEVESERGEESDRCWLYLTVLHPLSFSSEFNPLVHVACVHLVELASSSEVGVARLCETQHFACLFVFNHPAWWFWYHRVTLLTY